MLPLCYTSTAKVMRLLIHSILNTIVIHLRKETFNSACADSPHCLGHGLSNQLPSSDHDVSWPCHPTWHLQHQRWTSIATECCCWRCPLESFPIPHQLTMQNSSRRYRVNPTLLLPLNNAYKSVQMADLLWTRWLFTCRHWCNVGQWYMLQSTQINSVGTYYSV